MTNNCSPIGHFTVVSKQLSWGIDKDSIEDVYMCRECRIRADFDPNTMHIRTNAGFGDTDHNTCDVCKKEGSLIP